MAALEDLLARVLGVPGSTWLRPDTPLQDIGVDALVRVLLVDACRESGIALDAQRAWSAQTVGDLHQAVGVAAT